LYDSGDASEFLYYVMPLMEGHLIPDLDLLQDAARLGLLVRRLSLYAGR